MDEKSEKDTAEKAEAKESSYGTFEEYLATLDEPVRELYDKHTAGLKTALEKERDDRRALAEQLKNLQPKAEKGSELEKQLSETLGKLEQVERRATFVEQAMKPEIGCLNPKVAYALAMTENLFTDKGDPDWSELKRVAPELFKTSVVTNAGTQSKPVYDINAEIRGKAGY